MLEMPESAFTKLTAKTFRARLSHVMKQRLIETVFITLLSFLFACGGGGLSGKASWYGGRFHGRTTASGESFNQYAMTAAHKTLPFGTRVKVSNTNNGKSVVVRINDRGPYKRGRVIDLSKGAAELIGMIRSGVVPVKIEVLE